MNRLKIWCKGTDSNLNFNKPRWFECYDSILNKYYPLFEFFDENSTALKHFKPIFSTGIIDIHEQEIYQDDILEDTTKTRYRVYFIAGGFVVKAKYCSKSLEDLTEDDKLITVDLSHPLNRSWIENNCKIVGNFNEKPV